MLYAFGSNGSGQLGIGHKQDVSHPTRSLLPATIAPGSLLKVAAGGNHTVALFSSGEAFSTGENANGRCGYAAEDTTSESHFAKICILLSHEPVIAEFKLCASTWEATTLVTRTSEVYSCGTGLKGQLGLGTGETDAPIPRQIRVFPPQDTDIVDIASCMAHTVVVLSNGEVYGWGDGRKGQLGEPRGSVWSPRKIEGLGFPVKRAACGREFTYLVGHPNDGLHAVLGADKWMVKSKIPNSALGWTEIGATWGSIFLLRLDNHLLSWGRNDHGQLGPSSVPRLKQIATGSEHVLGLTIEGKLISWGWGEHGNCGLQTDADGDVKDNWSEISLTDGSTENGVTVMGIGAGCASSWVFTSDDSKGEGKNIS